ncbi:hypothetical protein BKA19_2001 [Blastococcus saxobsidens]|uniref:DUF6968 domain-containing protein n=2 Tax=Blastococcus saxobsidens TaxID=138336 RepID=A0A4V2G299_9ACTN|nr:hypothetical protein [Blastococcus saxobsidens]RZU32306.1 hypothetical protein BKA19_2001 [Blastococcus saxobsidens]
MTMVQQLGQVVAERRLEAVAADGTRTPVTVLIGAPVPDPAGGGDWFCPHRVDGLGEDSAGGAFGVDSLQALLLSVHALRLGLDQRAEEASVRLEWLGLPDTGLTVPPPFLGLRPRG